MEAGEMKERGQREREFVGGNSKRARHGFVCEAQIVGLGGFGKWLGFKN